MTQILDQRTIEINIPSKIGYERIAMESSASFAQLAGLLPERIEDLKSAVAEACINAMQHGNKWRPEARVIINMHLRDDRCIISVMDQGDGLTEVPEYPGITKIIEENATKQKILNEPFEWLNNNDIKDDDVIIFFFQCMVVE